MDKSNQRIIGKKLGLLNLAEELHNVATPAASWAYRATRFIATRRLETKAVWKRCLTRAGAKPIQRTG